MIALREVQASLSLFAESLTGVPVAFAVIDDPAHCWPWSTEPTEAVPVLPVEMDSRSSYRTILLHQLLRQTDPLSAPSVTLLDRLVNLVENHRVVGQIHRSFPGASGDVCRLLDDAVVRHANTQIDDQESATATGLLQVLHRHTLGATTPAMTDIETRAVALIDEVLAPTATGATSVRVAQELLHLFDPTHGAALARPLPDPEPDPESDAMPAEATTGVSLDGGTPSEIVDSQHTGGGQLSSDLSDLDSTPTERDDAEDLPTGFQLPTTVSAQALPAKARSYVYDEWDYHLGQHRPAWCRVIEERLEGDDHEFIADVRRRHQALRSHVRRRMLQLPSQHLVRVHRSLDGEELDLDAAIEAVVDRRSGAPVDDRLQVRRDRAARDIATAFLVDLSASTSSPSVPPQPAVFEDTDPMDDPMSYGPLWEAPRVVEPVRRVIDVAKDAVALMADAVHELGDLYAVYGFSGTGREGVEFKIGKDFRDRTSPASWASIAAMRPLRYTRMGPAVRHAASKLAAVSAQTRLLIVVSDGYPQDTDYGRDRNDRDYGMHDTARALRDATDAGIETFCVTIDPAGHDYLRDMCPDGRYLVIDDVESLPEELAKLYLLTIGA